ncbi:MAG: SET domain-containing protein-lysine N-methyltransferase [Patescibacteria group bacterium]
MEATAPSVTVKDASSGKGQGLFADADIKKGAFVAEYTGTKVDSKEADAMKSKYLFEIDDEWTIDAEHGGSVARYINHSCDPNTEAEIVDLPAPRPNTFFVYVIECENGAMYIGQTQNLLKRWNEHTTGRGAEYTSKYRPRGIVHSEEYSSREEAVAREKWLKTGFGRKWIKREIKAGRLPVRSTQTGARQAGGRIIISAIKKITEGEEITIDYGDEYFDEFIRPHGCRCGAKKHH